MDLKMPMARHKRHCEDISSSVGENADRISNLPDEIIVQIISHLVTKEAVATSILSKRWEYLWTSTSNLYFSDDFLSTYQNESDRKIKSLIFTNYVNRVIFCRGSSILLKCGMIFKTNYFSDHIYTWICALITCNIKELHLMDHSLTARQLPWRLFTCKSLVELTIYGSFVLDLPTYVYFPSLKVLRLLCVVPLDDASMHKLLTSCPVLEDLFIGQNNDCVIRVLNISIPSLKRLTIYSNVHNCRIEINTPSLEYFLHTGLSYCSANMLPSLIRAELGGYLNIKLLNAISQVQSLVLKEFLMPLPSIIDRDVTLPTFNKLKEIKLHVHKNFDWKFLLKFLKCTPNLQHLAFPSGLVSLTTDGLDFDRFHWPWPEFVPECLSLNVKKIEICNFVGFEEELHLVKYLLEFGKVMDKLIIHKFDFSTKPRIEERMKELVEADRIMFEMLSYERGSAACEVVFSA